jgi:hypothetical protein
MSKDTNGEKQFISYVDDNGTVIEGYFEVLDLNHSYIEFRSHGNKVRIPWHRVLKNKEKEVMERKKYGN